MLRESLRDALKDAMRARQSCKVDTLRLILAALKDRDIAARGEGQPAVSDDEILAMLQKMVRQRQDSIAMYEEAGRIDLVEREQEEMRIVRSFMPEQMSEEEIREASESVMSELGAHGIKDMGRMMSAMKERYAGRMDFGRAACVVKGLLT
ncbi:MAG: GatB/YqeY domain-containing protein [Sneathiellaceae bacterium]